MTGRSRKSTVEDRRRRILDCTEEIIRTEGYAAVTSRRVGAAAGIQASLVHYYFATIDDLFVAVLTRGGARTVARMTEALVSPAPLRAWWALASDRHGTALLVELLAAANHRPALRAEVGRFAEDVRRVQVEALETLLGEYGVDAEEFPPALVAAMIQGLAFGAVQDRAAGYDTGSAEVFAAVERLIDRLESRRTAGTRREGRTAAKRAQPGGRRLRAPVKSSR